YADTQALRATLEPMGIRLRENEVEHRGPLAILGVGDLSTHHARFQRTVAAWRGTGGVPVLLTHNPLITRRLPPAAAAGQPPGAGRPYALRADQLAADRASFLSGSRKDPAWGLRPQPRR